MADLNKFLDLEGLKTFWNQIDKKKQNQEIIIKGEKTTIEDYLNNSKNEIDLEEIKKIIQNYLDENPIEVEGYVPTDREIAGINLIDNITTNELQESLEIYPLIIDEEYVSNHVGKKGQLRIYPYRDNEWWLAFCKGETLLSNGTIRYEWITIGHLSKSDIITTFSNATSDSKVPSAKLFKDTVDNINKSLESKVEQSYVDNLFNSIVNGSEVSW